jgi:hypothetical protein
MKLNHINFSKRQVILDIFMIRVRIAIKLIDMFLLEDLTHLGHSETFRNCKDFSAVWSGEMPLVNSVGLSENALRYPFCHTVNQEVTSKRM